jgi:hypothetical protein
MPVEECSRIERRLQPMLQLAQMLAQLLSLLGSRPFQSFSL